jgi:glycosyltransferase involved in cell wall biosynthesis
MLNISAFAPIVAMSGRLTPLKGHEVLLQAAPHVLARFPDTRFVLIGSEVDIHGTSFVDHLKTTTTHLSLDSRVVFAGELQDAAKFNCDCDVSCSLTRPFGDAPLGEAFGLAVLEAMIAGVPVVGTSFGATPELISPGINGLLVPPNEPRAVAEALIALLEDGPRRKRMGEQGRRIAQERFDIRQTARATEELWQLVCRGQKAPEKGPS